MLRFKQFLIEGLVNQRNYAHSGAAFDARSNSNFWSSLYDEDQAKLLTPEQKRYIERITGSEQHEYSKLHSYTGKNSSQERLQAIKDKEIEKLKNLEDWKPTPWQQFPPEPDMQKEIKTLIQRLEFDKKNILTGDSLFTKTTDKPMTVYRSINADPNSEWGKLLSDKIAKGEVIRDTNLLSTTTEKGKAVGHNFYPSNTSTKILQIDVPAGTKYFVNPLSKAGPLDPNLGFNVPEQLNNFGYAEDEILFPRESGLQIDSASNELSVHQMQGPHAGEPPQKVQVHKAKIVSPESTGLDSDRLMTEIDSQLEYLQKELQKQISFDNAINKPDVISSITPTKLTKDAEKVGMTGKQVSSKAAELADTAVEKSALTKTGKAVGIPGKVAKALPIAGAVLSAPDAIRRAEEGDYAGAVGAFASNFDPTGTIPWAMHTKDTLEQRAKEATTLQRSAQGGTDALEDWFARPFMDSSMTGKGSNVRQVVQPGEVSPARAKYSDVVVAGSVEAPTKGAPTALQITPEQAREMANPSGAATPTAARDALQAQKEADREKRIRAQRITPTMKM